MIKISVVSNDKLFSSMLCNEIEAMSEDYKIVSEKAEIVIIDLDGVALSEELASACVVGFSRNEKSLPGVTVNKCRAILHRPFLVEDLKKLIKEIVSESAYNEDLASEKTAITFDRGSLSVYLDGSKVALSLNEYAVLRKLYENKNSPVSRSELNEVLSSSGGNMCDVYICHLRSKLESGGNKKYVFTVRGKGYMLKI